MAIHVHFSKVDCSRRSLLQIFAKTASHDFEVVSLVWVYKIIELCQYYFLDLPFVPKVKNCLVTIRIVAVIYCFM